MPRRNEEQRIKRNEARRNLKKRSRKAIFCLDHLQITHPDIHKEAIDLYDFINQIYPHKHNLTKTALYQKTIQNTKVKRQAINHAALPKNTSRSRQVQPRLEIPLMPSATTRDQPEEAAQQITVTDQEIQSIIADLQQEPDLKSFFNEMEVCGSEVRAKTLEEEIDAIIQAEFQSLRAEFQDLTNELLC